VELKAIHRRATGRPGLQAGLRWRNLLPSIGLALLIPLAHAAAQDPAQDPAQDQTAHDQTAAPGSQASAMVTVHGVVRNAATGDPLPRALVRLEGDANTGTLTDGEGRFEISGLAAGPQLFEVLKPGFLDRGGVSGATVTDDATGSAHNVMVVPEMAGLEFALAPSCSIRGHVELSTGDPAQGIEVQLLKRSVQDGRGVWQAAGAAKTLSDGTYRFAGLSDGQYVVYSSPAMDSESAAGLVAPGRGANVTRDGYASQFYPDARDIAGAAKIAVSNGEQAQANLNLTLEPFHAVTATATFPDSEKGAAGAAADHSGVSYSAVVTDAQGHQLPYVALYDQVTRAVQALLPDGTYSLLLTASRIFMLKASPVSISLDLAANGRSWNLVPNTGPFVGSVEFSVAGHAISNLRVPLTAGHGSSVQLTVQRNSTDSTPARQGRGSQALVMMSQAGGWIGDGLSSAFAQGDGPGQLEATYLPPGSYWAHARFAQKSLCEASFTGGGASLAREPLVLGISGTTAPMELIARDDCAKLALSLPPTLAALTAGEEHFYTVYVVPDFDSTTDVEPVTLRPSSGATVTIEGLTPGGYHVYTFSSPVALEYRNRDVLASLPEPGQAITLSPGTTGSLVLEAPGR
jgi:hypothetical protein